ncbi:acyl carrier protein [Puniceicoccaceae bacterium K14]|nr:acyl carrier protein [Puniceicoccaceae bacterium K14]
MKNAHELEALISAFLTDDLLVEDDSSLTPESNLFAEGYIDSIGIMRLIAHLESELDTKIPPKDLVPKNFMTIKAMVAYLATQRSPAP